MRTVNIAELKNSLSRYLAHVKDGEEILVRDRKLPFARIVPIRETRDFDAEELGLIAQGKLRPPRKALDVDAFLAGGSRSRRVPTLKRMIRAVQEDRAGRDDSLLGR